MLRGLRWACGVEGERLRYGRFEEFGSVGGEAGLCLDEGDA